MAREERGEWREHRVDDVSMEGVKGIPDGNEQEGVRNPLAEAYVEGCCEIHVHFRAGTVEGGVLGDWCALIKIAGKGIDVVDGDVLAREERYSTEPIQGHGRRKPVLVYDLKLIKLPQAVAAKPVPSIVRLQPLDDCLGTWVDAPDHVVEFLQRLRAFDLGGVRREDGEPGSPLNVARQRSLRLRKSKSKCEVVEGGAEVVDAVPGDEAQASRRRFEHPRPYDLLAALVIEFGPKGVRACLTPGSQFRFKALQMVERPVEPPFVVEDHTTGSMPKDRTEVLPR
jgi:hypothetical protein